MRFNFLITLLHWQSRPLATHIQYNDAKNPRIRHEERKAGKPQTWYEGTSPIELKLETLLQP
jgi:hypothetical protein